MENQLTEKEKLQKQLAKIEEQEFKDFVDTNYPLIKKQYEGKYFRIRNSYGSGKTWWLYKKVTKIERKDIYAIRNSEPTATCEVFSFQKCAHNRISIELYGREYVHGLGKEITKAEFTKVWKAIQAELKQIN